MYIPPEGDTGQTPSCVRAVSASRASAIRNWCAPNEVRVERTRNVGYVFGKWGLGRHVQLECVPTEASIASRQAKPACVTVYAYTFMVCAMCERGERDARA
jgi:hypothetical protein